jgi:hypothetical protein
MMNCQKSLVNPNLLSVPYGGWSDVPPDAFAHFMEILDGLEEQFSSQFPMIRRCSHQQIQFRFCGNRSRLSPSLTSGMVFYMCKTDEHKKDDLRFAPTGYRRASL